MPPGAVQVVVLPAHIASLPPVILHAGGERTVKSQYWVLLVQNVAVFVTVTAYVPATVGLMLCVAAVNPPGPVHE